MSNTGRLAGYNTCNAIVLYYRAMSEAAVLPYYVVLNCHSPLTQEPVAVVLQEPPVGDVLSATHSMDGLTPAYPVLHSPTHADPASVSMQLAGHALALVTVTLLGGAVPQPAGNQPAHTESASARDPQSHTQGLYDILNGPL